MMVDVSKKKTPYVVLNEVCDSIPCLLDYNIPHKKRKSYLRCKKKFFSGLDDKYALFYH